MPNFNDLLKKIRLIAFDFDGVFTDNMVQVSENGQESILCCRSDGLGLKMLDDIGIQKVIISTETNNVVQKRAQKLKIECFNSVNNKLSFLKDLLGQKGIDLSETAFVGNDINDLECLKAVGFPIVVSDCWPDVENIAIYKTTRKGGYGAVREICELFYTSIRK